MVGHYKQSLILETVICFIVNLKLIIKATLNWLKFLRHSLDFSLWYSIDFTIMVQNTQIDLKKKTCSDKTLLGDDNCGIPKFQSAK